MNLLRSSRLAPLAAALALALPVRATTWYVNLTAGSEDNDGLSPSTPKRYLKTTINTTAAAGDTVFVIGTYGTGETIEIKKKLLVVGYGQDAALSGKNSCLPLKLNASGLVVSNLVIHSGSPVGAAAGTWSYPASGVEVANGTLVDCTVRDCSPQGATHTSTVYVSGAGTVLRCAITNNTSGIQTASYGAGLYIGHADAVVRDCEIAYNRGRACAVYMTKGLVTGCDIHDNRNYSVSELASGNSAGSGAGIRVDGGTLERSRIHDNYSHGSGGGLWLRDNAIVRNCLIYGNHAGGSGGAIHANSGSPKTYHCNIGGNTADAGGTAVNSGAGTPQYVNCIVFGNGSAPSDEILTASGVTASFTYCLLPVTRSGTGNGVLVASPYRDEANGDYLTALPLAPAIDKGQAGLATVDFLGTARPLDGDGDGTEKADIGAVEYNPAAQGGAIAAIASSATVGTFPMTVTFTLDLTDFDATGVTAVWDFGDGSAPLTTNADAAVVHDYGTEPGRFYPSALVSDRSGHSCTAQFTEGVDVRPKEVFVSKTGSATYPYDTPEKASPSVWTAYAALCPETVPDRTVTILPGEYQLSSKFTLDKPCFFRGDGPLGTVVFSGRGLNSIFKVAHADAVVSNLAFRAGYSAGVQNDAANASGVEITAGLVTHCEISGCRARDDYSAQAVTLGGSASAQAVLANSVVTNNTGYLGASNPSGQYPRGAGVYMADYALVTNCLIAENRAWSGAGVFLKNGAAHSTLRGCRIERNAALGTGGGILSFGGSVERCHVISNYTENAGSGGGIRILSSGKVKNCLVTGNRASLGGGLYASQDGVTILHCTIAGNVADSVSGVFLDAGTVTCSIIHGNSGSDDLSIGSGAITYSCVPTPVAGTGNISSDPMFRDAAGGDYRLAPGSPCRDAAVTNAVGGYSTAVDIDYAARPVDSDGNGTALPDMGCYEMPYEEAAPALSIQSSQLFGSPGNLFTFTSLTTGFAPGAETEFTWDFGDGSEPYSSGSSPTATHQFEVGGLHTVTLRCVDAGLGIDLSATLSVGVRVAETYVAPDGADTPPYDTPARAATSLDKALAYTYAPSGGTGRVHIAEGLYSGHGNLVEIKSRIEVVGAGRGRTVFSAIRFSLDHRGARLAGMTITNVANVVPFTVKVSQGTFADAEITRFISEGSSCGLVLDGLHAPAGGTVCLATNVLVQNCTITKNGSTTSGGAGVRMLNGAWLVDSTVRDCASEGDGAGVYVSGASGTNAVLRCRLTGNRSTGATSRGGGLHAKDGAVRVEDTVLDGNETGGCGAISISEKVIDATLLNLVVTNNVCTTYAGAGIRSDATNVVVAGCLVRDNVRISNTGNAAGLFLWHGRAVNCTITGNRGGTGAAGVLLYGDDALLLNSVVCGNVPVSYASHPEVAPTADVTPAITNLLTTSPLPWEAGNVIVADDPRLRADGTPKPGSPAIDAGDSSFWKPEWGVRDLGDKARIRGLAIDLGCFEYTQDFLFFGVY